MSDLGRCVNAGIGTTRAGNLDSLVGDRTQGVFDECLHANPGTLALPAVVRRTVVLQTYCNSHLE
jgi:hypothetical protein